MPVFSRKLLVKLFFYPLGVQLKKTNNRGTKASEIAFGPEDVKEYLQ